MRALFLYWKTGRAAEAAALDALIALQARLQAAHPRLVVRRFRRDDAGVSRADGLVTWMETYEHPAGIDAALQAEIEAEGRALVPHLSGIRHVEAFTPLP